MTDPTAAAEDAAWERLEAAGAASGAGADVLRYGAHADQLIEVHGSPDATALVVLVHGGYFRPAVDRVHARPFAAFLAEATGARVWLPEYRRVAGDPDVTLADLRAIDRLANSSAATVWVGHSAGGMLVLWRACATDLAPVPVVALAPVADLARAAADGLGSGAVVDWLGGTPSVVPDRYAAIDPAPRLGAVRAPLRVMVAAQDATVPRNQADALATVPQARVDVVDPAHHFDLVDPATAAGAAVAEAAAEALRPPGSSWPPGRR